MQELCKNRTDADSIGPILAQLWHILAYQQKSSTIASKTLTDIFIIVGNVLIFEIQNYQPRGE